MASTKNSTSGVSPEEISELIGAFESQNQCRVSVELRNGLMGGKVSLELIAHAWNNHTGSTGAPLLASASVRCSALRLATLEGAIIRVLYSLDAQLAQEEFAKLKNKSA